MTSEGYREKGLNPSTLVWTYEAILKPSLTYVAVAWWKTEKKKAVVNWKKVWGLMLKEATKSTPMAALVTLTAYYRLNN